MGVDNTDLAKQLGARFLAARLWRLRPGQASTRHRHLLPGGALRPARGHRPRPRRRGPAAPSAPSTLSSSTGLDPPDLQRHRRRPATGWRLALRPEGANTLEMSEEKLKALYPDGPESVCHRSFERPDDCGFRRRARPPITMKLTSASLRAARSGSPSSGQAPVNPGQLRSPARGRGPQACLARGSGPSPVLRAARVSAPGIHASRSPAPPSRRASSCRSAWPNSRPNGTTDRGRVTPATRTSEHLAGLPLRVPGGLTGQLSSV